MLAITQRLICRLGPFRLVVKSFQIHKQLGVYGKFLVPLHVGGAFVHSIRGHAIFNRVNPFAVRPKY